MKNLNILKSVLNEANLYHTKKSDSIDSYAQLVKSLAELEVKNYETISNTINKANFIEDDETTFNNLPLSIKYKQLPVVIGADLLVKVVVLEQGDNIAIIVPENTSTIYEELLEEDFDNLTNYNINLSLYAEVYGFDTNNSKFLELLKNMYLSAGNFIKAFSTPEVVQKTNEEDDEENSEFDFTPSSSTDNVGGADDFDMDETSITDDISSFEEIKENMKAYNKFTVKTKSLTKLVERLRNTSKVLSDNIKFKYLNENKSVLVIEVDNRSIYNAFPKAKNIAKQTITKLGESIRTSTETQLLDSFNIKGKRYFVVAENNSNNYWTVAYERLEAPEDNSTVVEPIQRNIIKLKRSNIRKESRVNKPFKLGKKIVFKSVVK